MISSGDYPWKRIREILSQIDKLNRAILKQPGCTPTDWQMRRLKLLENKYRAITGIKEFDGIGGTDGSHA